MIIATHNDWMKKLRRSSLFIEQTKAIITKAPLGASYRHLNEQAKCIITGCSDGAIGLGAGVIFYKQGIPTE
jgi:hypothetical protein